MVLMMFGRGRGDAECGLCKPNWGIAEIGQNTRNMTISSTIHSESDNQTAHSDVRRSRYVSTSILYTFVKVTVAREPCRVRKSAADITDYQSNEIQKHEQQSQPPSYSNCTRRAGGADPPDEDTESTAL